MSLCTVTDYGIYCGCKEIFIRHNFYPGACESESEVAQLCLTL